MFAKISVKKPYTVAVGVILVIVLGIVSFTSMTTDLLPSMNLPYIMVYTTYTGASPETIENEITKPLEASMATVGNLEGISSTSSENVSMITLQFTQDASMDTAMLELNAKIDLVVPSFPDGAGTPTMIKLNPDMLPVVIAAVDMEGKDIIDLSDYVDQVLLNEMEGIDGIASVSPSGLVDEEITVSIEQSLIDEVNDIILKEVDAELYKVEQQLLDGEKQLNDAKKMLQREGRAGLRKLDEALQQLQNAREKMGETIGGLNSQKEELTAQLEQAKSAIPALEADLEALGGAAMSQQDRDRLSAMDDALKKLDVQLKQAEKDLDEVNRKLQGENPATPEPETPEQTSAPEETPEDETASTPEIMPDSEEQLEQEEQEPIPEIEKQQETAVPIQPKEELHPSEEAQNFALNIGMRTAYADADPELLQEKARLEALIEEIKAQKSEIESSDEYQTLKALEEDTQKKAQLEEALAQARDGVQQLESGIAQLEETIRKLEAGILPGGFIEGIDEDTTLDEAEAMLIKTREEAAKQIKSASGKIEEAQRKLGEGRKEFEENREEAFKNAKLDGVITVPMISQIVAAQNLSMPAGYLTENGQEYLVRIGDKYQSVDELADSVLFTMDLDSLKEVRLKDVATVELTNNADTVYARVNGNDGVMLSFQKQSTYSTAEVADSVLEKFEQLEKEHPGLHLTPLLDQGIYIDMIIDSVLSNLLSGAALAILVLLIFLLDYRPTLVIALSIPTSVVVAFVAMYFTGITLNVISLAGLALGVGMLVDNSIVVIENIYRLHDEGMPTLRACVEGTKQMSAAIASSTLTTICVFLPLVFVNGMAKDLFTDMGLTITYSLLASLLVAMTVVPALCSVILKTRKKHREGRVSVILKGYGKLLSAALKFKLPVLLLAGGLLAYSVTQAFSMGTAFIPEVDSTQMSATLTVDPDFTFKQKTQLADKVLNALLEIDEIDTIGVFESGGLMMSGGNSDSVNYYIQLKEDKVRRNTEIAKEMTERVKPLNVDLSIQTNNMDISALNGSGITINVKGPDMEKLRVYATDIAEKLRDIEGTVEISDGQEKTEPEMNLIVDKTAAVENGLTVAQIYQFVAQLVSDGVEISNMTLNDREYAIMAVDGDNLKLTREELEDKTIEVEKADETIQVRLGDVCEITESESLTSISRSEQQHVISVSCDVDAEHNIGLVGREVEEMLARYSLDEGYSASVSGESETITSTIMDLLKMIGLAVILIYLIMVAQFQSFLMPFIVLFTIPLAITGGLMALILLKLELSMVAMLGFLILSGVIVNNGIVFVDTVNQLRAGGMEKRSALIQAGQLRMRPILMTALTTILGMSTMALARGMGAEMMQPLALVTIGGLTYGTLLTMFVVPALYDLLTGKKYKVRNIEGEEEHTPEISDLAIETDEQTFDEEYERFVLFGKDEEE